MNNRPPFWAPHVPRCFATPWMARMSPHLWPRQTRSQLYHVLLVDVSVLTMDDSLQLHDMYVFIFICCIDLYRYTVYVYFGVWGIQTQDKTFSACLRSANLQEPFGQATPADANDAGEAQCRISPYVIPNGVLRVLEVGEAFWFTQVYILFTMWLDSHTLMFSPWSWDIGPQDLTPTQAAAKKAEARGCFWWTTVIGGSTMFRPPFYTFLLQIFKSLC